MVDMAAQLKRGRAEKAVCNKDRYDRARAYMISDDDTRRLNELITPYQCKLCGWWHVGHFAKKGSQDAR